MKLPFLKESYLDELEGALGTRDGQLIYLERETFPLNADGLTKDSHIDVSEEIPVLIANEVPVPEAEAAIAVHRWLRGIDRASALCPRLWVYLAHGPFYSYLKARWPLNEKTVQSKISDHWFLKIASQRSFRRHGIAVLYWGAELTHVSESEVARLAPACEGDPYFYTRMLFSNQNLLQALLERTIGRDPRLLMAALESLRKCIVGNDKLSPTQVAKELGKELNILAGASNLSGCSERYLATALDTCIGNMFDRLSAS